MGHLGFGEILLILLVLLLVFGTSRLPALGDALGRGIRNFRKAHKDGAPEDDESPTQDPKR
jgi:sec-independent protein translocase protein TatA